jgi:hypothetical protein
VSLLYTVATQGREAFLGSGRGSRDTMILGNRRNL